jgi:hypothetical protein
LGAGRLERTFLDRKGGTLRVFAEVQIWYAQMECTILVDDAMQPCACEIKFSSEHTSDSAYSIVEL